MPTDEQRALWAALRANPDDDTVRLVYADWLQENGDEARAEFIRAQFEVLRLIACRPNGKRTKEEGAANARSEQLLAPNRTRWTDEFVRVIRPSVDRNDRREVKEMRARRMSLQFYRGFLSPTLSTRELSAVLRAEAAIEPLDHVRFVSDRDGSAEVFRSLAGSPLAHRVQYLHLTDASDDLTAVVAACGCLPHALTFRVNANLSDRGLTALAAVPSGRVTLLDLGQNQIGDEGAAALARSPLLSAVVNLHLSNNRIEDAGAIALAESPYLQQIVWLTIGGNGIGPVGWRRLQERFGNRVYPRP